VFLDKNFKLTQTALREAIFTNTIFANANFCKIKFHKFNIGRPFPKYLENV